jgi:hypothetical protein
MILAEIHYRDKLYDTNFTAMNKLLILCTSNTSMCNNLIMKGFHLYDNGVTSDVSSKNFHCVNVYIYIYTHMDIKPVTAGVH